MAQPTARLQPPAPPPPPDIFTRAVARPRSTPLSRFVVECWCGDAFLPTTSARLSKCSTVCDGSLEACGGAGHVNVYTIPLPPNTPQPPHVVAIAGGDTDLLGCYPDNSDNMATLNLKETRALTMTNYVSIREILCVQFTPTTSIAQVSSKLCRIYVDWALCAPHRVRVYYGGP